MRKPRSRAMCQLIFLLLSSSVAIEAQMDEYSVKAGYLYNFSKYVAWPEDAFPAPGAPLLICIVGEDPFAGKLDHAVAGRTAGDGRRLQVKRISSTEPEALRECQMAFVSKSEKRRAEEIIKAIRGAPIFAVADFSSFAEQGGIANLRIEGTKVKVDLNMNAANRGNLKVSGRLQQVANLVNENN